MSYCTAIVYPPIPSYGNGQKKEDSYCDPPKLQYPSGVCHPPKLGCHPCIPKHHCPPVPPRYLPKDDKCHEVIKVTNDICKTTTWVKEKTYLISAEVHVKARATLNIEEGTEVLFKECKLCCPLAGGLEYASLVVDSGAAIQARRVEFRAQNNSLNNTGGVIVCGTLKTAFFENYTTVFSTNEVKAACSKLVCCSFNYLGNSVKNINGLTLFNVSDDSELGMSNLSVNFAGDDALQIVGGTHSIDYLNIKEPIDDGIDLDEDAILNVSGGLTIIGNANKDSETNLNEGAGLVEVIGTGTNTLNVLAGANVYMLGRITDETTGTTTFGGLFGGAVPGQIGKWSGVAPVGTFIMGSP